MKSSANAIPVARTFPATDLRPSGPYAFYAHVLEPGWFVKSVHLGNEDVLEEGLQVENGAVSGSLEVVISSGIAQLEGTVTDNDQNPAGARAG